MSVMLGALVPREQDRLQCALKKDIVTYSNMTGSELYTLNQCCCDLADARFLLLIFWPVTSGLEWILPVFVE